MDTFLLLLKGDIFQDTLKNIKPHSDCGNQIFFVASTKFLLLSRIFLSKLDALITSFVDLKTIYFIDYFCCPEITIIWVVALSLFFCVHIYVLNMFKYDICIGMLFT